MAQTIVEILQAAELAVAENADYLATGSIVKARLFHAAVSQLLVIRPQRAGFGREGYEAYYDVVSLRNFERDVVAWLAANGGLPAVAPTDTASAPVVNCDLSTFRDD